MSDELTPDRVVSDDARDWSRAALERLDDAAQVLDAEWRCRYLNASARATARWLGTDPAAMLGEVFWDVVPWLVGTEWERQARKAVATRTVVAFEASLPGMGRLYETRLVPLSDGGLLCLSRDVTDRARAAAARDEALSRLGSALRLAGLGTWSVDLRTRVGEHDDAAASMLGSDGRSDLPTIEQWLRQIHPDDLLHARTAFESTVAAAIAASRPAPEATPAESRADDLALRYESELRIVRPDGETRHLALSARVMCDAARTPERVVGVVRDVTTERTAAREREALLAREQRARAEAAAANEAKMQFLAVMSHELRTPLNAIGGYTQLLELGLRGPVTPQQLADLARIRSNQRHLMALVEDVLTYAKLDAGRMEFRIADVVVDEVASEVVGTMSPLAIGRALALEYAPSDAGVVVRADREKLRQILLNLVSNGMKFTPTGGRISIDVESNPGDVRIRVSDTGPGIADDQREHIFEAFVQLARNTTAPHEGAGLGLAISRDLAVGMGGDLRVASTVGHGATFTLTLPRPMPT